MAIKVVNFTLCGKCGMEKVDAEGKCYSCGWEKPKYGHKPILGNKKGLRGAYDVKGSIVKDGQGTGYTGLHTGLHRGVEAGDTDGEDTEQT